MDPFTHPIEGRGTQLLPSAPHMRYECLERAWDDVHASFTNAEMQTINDLFCQAVQNLTRSPEASELTLTKANVRDWRTHPGLAIIARDTEFELPISKWYLLASWLAPESAVSYAPDLVLTIVERAIKGTLGNRA